MNRVTLSAVLLGALACAACASRDLATGAQAAAAPLPSSVQPGEDLSDRAFSHWLSVERDRIERARAVARERFEAAELGCWHRFAVNDCISDARSERRATLDALRREELAVNQHERARRTAARMRQLEDKRPSNATTQAPAKADAPRPGAN